MQDLNRDLIKNAIYNGIKRSIIIAYENECYRACLILIYSGIDTMATLSLPPERENVKKEDFINWTNNYIDLTYNTFLNGIDLYGARCGMVHNYGVESRLSQQERCKVIGYMNQSDISVRYNEKVSNELIMVSIKSLKESFFNGIDKFLIDIERESSNVELINKRLNKLVASIPI